MLYRRQRKTHGGSATKTNAGESSETKTQESSQAQSVPQADSDLRLQTAEGRVESLPQTEEAQERGPQESAETERGTETAAAPTAGESSETPSSGEAQKSRRHSRSGVEPSAEKEKSSGKNSKT